MSERHHVIVGMGITGNEAAITLRRREPQSRITIVTLASLLFYNRYDLPQVFRGKHDWRDFLVHQPAFYDDNRITVRRNSRVSNVDPLNKVMTLEHKEDIPYDTLLVATGGRGWIPEELAEFRPLMQGFGSFEQAITVARALPEGGGRVVMLGGDMIGLDLARTLIDTGHRVTLVAGEQTFWPHQVPAERRPAFVAALEAMGVEVVEQDSVGGVAQIAQGAKGLPARRVVFRDGSELMADVVMPFYGIQPAIDFMGRTGVDVERGLLVNPELRTTDASIWAAGDVCQIWSQEENRYRFYYGWRNVRAMGEVAAGNMTGGNDAFVADQDEKLEIDAEGRLVSPFWEYA